MQSSIRHVSTGHPVDLITCGDIASTELAYAMRCAGRDHVEVFPRPRYAYFPTNAYAYLPTVPYAMSGTNEACIAHRPARFEALYAMC
eukprot:2071060-Rhodomonas_salina.1